MRLDEFKELNRSKNLHWFDEGTMRFFQSKIHDWDPVSGLFISSERGPVGNENRKYSIRAADFDSGNVRTISLFQEYKTLGRAQRTWRSMILDGSWRRESAC